MEIFKLEDLVKSIKDYVGRVESNIISYIDNKTDVGAEIHSVPSFRFFDSIPNNTAFIYEGAPWLYCEDFVLIIDDDFLDVDTVSGFTANGTAIGGSATSVIVTDHRDESDVIAKYMLQPYVEKKSIPIIIAKKELTTSYMEHFYRRGMLANVYSIVEPDIKIQFGDSDRTQLNQIEKLMPVKSLSKFRNMAFPFKRLFYKDNEGKVFRIR